MYLITVSSSSIFFFLAIFSLVFFRALYIFFSKLDTDYFSFFRRDLLRHDECTPCYEKIGFELFTLRTAPKTVKTMFRLRPRWYFEGPLERRMTHWLSRIQHRRFKQSSATANKPATGKAVTPASLIAGSKVGKQLAVESQELTDAIRNIGVIAHIDAGRKSRVRHGSSPDDALPLLCV